MTDRMGEFVDALARAGRVVQRSKVITADATISKVAAGAVGLLPGVQHAGVLLAWKGKAWTAAASELYPRVLDRIHNDYGQGPGLAAAHGERVVHVEDVVADRRWPDFGRAAARETVVRSILSVNVSVKTPYRGALVLVAEYSNAFDAETEHMAAMYGVYAGWAWAWARCQEQFAQAVITRDVIGQAKGMIMAQFAVDADAAFAVLKRWSQSSNTPLAQVVMALKKTGQRC